jgi:hypothetical protein
MATHEVIPELTSQPFPLGDITDKETQLRAEAWLVDMADKDFAEYGATIKSHNKPHFTKGLNVMRNYAGAVALCKVWDESRPRYDDSGDEAMPFALIGYRLAMTFNQQTSYLGQATADHTKYLEQMARHDTEGGQREMAREFGRFAWEGMAYYPNVFGVFEQVLEIGKTRFDLYPSDNREYFQAGMALPYVLAIAAGLDHTPEFNSMSDGANPPAKEFGHLFTNVDIAPEDLPRKSYKVI